MLGDNTCHDHSSHCRCRGGRPISIARFIIFAFILLWLYFLLDWQNELSHGLMDLSYEHEELQANFRMLQTICDKQDNGT